jgi:glycosyltransferase involved in cell wall biosynthesis
MPKICFVETHTYAVLNPAYKGASSGGEAVQHSLLAREFAKQGWDTSVVCMDVGQQDGEIVDGVRVWKTFDREAGVPGIRFFYPRLYNVWRALKKADADVYFQSCAGLFAKTHKRKMIFRVAHDTDCIPGKQLIVFGRDRWLYEYGLRSADLISVQSDVQADLLKENYGMSSVGVNMIVEPPNEASAAEKDIDVLWVNNLREFKRPEIVLEIAKQMPDVSFVMIGGRMGGFESLFANIRADAEGIPNLRFLGAVPYSEVNDYFARAKLFLNTSDSEGFPNSYLQAWIRGVPVVSYFDPDGLIDSLDIGIKVPTQQDFCEAIRHLLQSPDRVHEIGKRSKKFAQDNYSPSSIVEEYRSLIQRNFHDSLINA